MKNNIKIINFLRILFKGFYRLSIIILVLNVPRDFIHLFNPDAVVDVPFLGNGSFNIDTSYDLFLGGHFKDNIEIGLDLGRIQSNELFYRLMAFFSDVVTILISIYLLRHVWQIFEELRNRKENGSYFSINIYSRIKKVGFLMLATLIYTFINGAVISWFLLDHVLLMGQEVYFQPDYTYMFSIVKVLIVFVFAEIYRAGIEMKEESEYTI